jgi:hypothetical protein
MKKNESTRFAWTMIPALLITMAAVAGPRERCDGRMTGGGSVFDNEQGEVTIDGNRVTHGFELHCDANRNPNNLQINWKDAQSNQHHFHLTDYLTAVCSDSPLIAPEPPVASFDTLVATGNGKYDGEAGAYAEWTFTDAGEGGSGDTATIRVWDADGNLVLDVSGFLTFGNHQAHNT